MKFAKVNNVRTEATKNAKGVCPICNSEVIAKCGDFKVHHWAHRGIRDCDAWWENETEWHRKWKDHFPETWQEIPLLDEKTGEVHIADVRTGDELVLEFQHSNIEKDERISREAFYKRMIWIVDGTRLKKDYPRFLKGKNGFRKMEKPGFYSVEYPIECFPATWLESKMPVVFDFLGSNSIVDLADSRLQLYCLLPKTNQKESILAFISREAFIAHALQGTLFKEKKEHLIKQPVINHAVKKMQEPTHYYDPKKGRFTKRKRF